MRTIAVLLLMLCSGVVAQASDLFDARKKMALAHAAVEACPELKINKAAVLELMKSLDANDQAEFASNWRIILFYAESAAKLFDAMDDKACEAARDFEKKLGLDLFVEVSE